MDLYFQNALEKFVKNCQELINAEYSRAYPNVIPPTLKVDEGKRYVKIVKQDISQRSVYAFVDTTNGDILKAATWKAPAKHARGNIFSENPMKDMTAYGAAYLR